MTDTNVSDYLLRPLRSIEEALKDAERAKTSQTMVYFTFGSVRPVSEVPFAQK